MRYMKIISAFLAVALLTVMIGCTEEQSKDIPLQSGSSHRSVSILLTGVKRTADETVLEITWNNSGTDSVMYGESFSLQFWNGESWEICKAKDHTGFEAIGYSLAAGSRATKQYTTSWIYGILQAGTYRFETTCHIYDTPEGSQCSLWTEFTLGSVPSADSGSTTPNNNLNQPMPPALLLQIAGSRGEVEPFAYQWFFKHANGESSSVSADPQQLPSAENMVVLKDCTQAYALMDFAVWPDSVSVRCWPDNTWGMEGAEAVPVEMDGKTFSLNPEAYIYEITATWNDDSGASYGTARYYTWISTQTLMPRLY